MTDRLTDEWLRQRAAEGCDDDCVWTGDVMRGMAAELLELRTFRDRMMAMLRRATEDMERFQRLYESGGLDVGVTMDRVLDERDQLRNTLAAIKAADPVLFDPTGGNYRGEAYEAYGTPGHMLRAAYCAAIGIDLDAIDKEGFDD